MLVSIILNDDIVGPETFKWYYRNMEIGRVLIILLLSIGSIQGLVCGVILFRSTSRNKLANSILAILLWVWSYRLIVQVMRLFGLGYYDGWYYFMVDISWVYGALIYFYSKAQSQPQLKFRKKDLLHFLPVVVQIGFSVFVRLQNLYWDGTRESLSWLGYYGYVVWMNNSTIYVIASALIIFYAYRSLKILGANDKSYEIDKDKLAWIKRIVKSFLVYFSLVLLVLLVDFVFFISTSERSYFYFTRFYYYPFFIGLSVLTYWIGFEGFSRRNDKEIKVKATINQKELERLRSISEMLKNAMQSDKLYKNPELSVNSLAKQLEIKPYLISKSLSEIFKKRFNDFVNEYRVREVQSLLEEEENSKYTLWGLALEAGFNSKSSFHRAVKKHLGISPGELKQRQ